MASYAPLDHALLVETHPVTPAEAVTVRMSGELDRENGRQVQGVIDDVLDRQQPQRVCMDMQQVTFLDAAGIRALLICRKRAAQQQCELKISRAHHLVRQVLTITLLLEVFHLQDV
jgi:stage II sporulation protein AA (anti-sigma F factor antagonist)